MDKLHIILQAVIDVCILVPAAISLIFAVRRIVRDKNWNILVKLIAQLMAKAETMYESGADKKAWVMGEVEVAAKTLNFDVDMDVVSDLIDRLCDMSKIVNGPEAK